MEQKQYSCHGYSNKKKYNKKKKKKKDTFWAHVHWYDRSTRLVTVSGTYTHRAPEAQEVVCIPKGTKAKHCEENTHIHTHTQNHGPSTLLVVTCWQAHPPPLVSQWTLLQPSWRMTRSDMSPATNFVDWTRWWKRQKKQKHKAFTHLKQSISPVKLLKFRSR